MEIGRIIIFWGIILIIIGVILILGGKFNIFGKLPGDLIIQKESIKIYFPFTSMILISMIGTIAYNLICRIFK